jgi:AraC-like DNA-binding protein
LGNKVKLHELVIKTDIMKLYIKHMVSNRCKIVVKEVLNKLGFQFVTVDLGEIEIMEEINLQQKDELKILLAESGLELMDDKKAILIERICTVLTEMIHNEDLLPETCYSTYISEKLNYDYTYLSNLFSEVKGITIQHFIIIHKVERIKELIIDNELNITEIAWKMHYSSVAHLSNQFKQITGFCPTHFKQLKEKNRNPICELGINAA